MDLDLDGGVNGAAALVVDARVGGQLWQLFVDFDLLFW